VLHHHEAAAPVFDKHFQLLNTCIPDRWRFYPRLAAALWRNR